MKKNEINSLDKFVNENPDGIIIVPDLHYNPMIEKILQWVLSKVGNRVGSYLYEAPNDVREQDYWVKQLLNMRPKSCKFKLIPIDTDIALRKRQLELYSKIKQMGGLTTKYIDLAISDCDQKREVNMVTNILKIRSKGLKLVCIGKLHLPNIYKRLQEEQDSSAIFVINTVGLPSKTKMLASKNKITIRDVLELFPGNLCDKIHLPTVLNQQWAGNKIQLLNLIKMFSLTVSDPVLLAIISLTLFTAYAELTTGKFAAVDDFIASELKDFSINVTDLTQYILGYSYLSRDSSSSCVLNVISNQLSLTFNIKYKLELIDDFLKGKEYIDAYLISRLLCSTQEVWYLQTNRFAAKIERLSRTLFVVPGASHPALNQYPKQSKTESHKRPTIHDNYNSLANRYKKSLNEDNKPDIPNENGKKYNGCSDGCRIL